MFGVDVLSLRYSDHDRYLQLGRIATAEVIAATFAEWRRKRSVCGGGLVWFLRDLIPGAGWGVVDAFGQPKSAYYAMKRVLQPIAVFISDEGCNGLAIHVVNESAERCVATLKLTLLRNGHVVVTESTREMVLEPHSNVELAANELFEGFYDLSFAYRFGPPAFDVAAATLKIADEVVSTAVHLPVPAASLNKCDVGITAVAEAEDETFKLVLKAQKFARFVSVHVDGFMSDDQYFDLIPGTERIVRLRAKMTSVAPTLRGVVSAMNGFTPVQIEMRA
jgi:beta-mannosidase